MVEAAGIEPSREHDTSDALSEQEPHTNHTPVVTCEDLFDTLRTSFGQNHDTWLHLVCEIYVKWTALPPALKKAVQDWDSVPEEVQAGLERLLNEAEKGGT